MGMQRLAAIVVLAATLLIASAGLFSAPAQAAAGDDVATYYSMINNLRTSRGLAPLQVHAGLAASSVTWANQLAATGTLAHDANLGSAVTGFLSLAENVGTGPNTDLTFDAFLSSPAHVGNLVNPAFTHVGVGVAYDATGRQWTTHRFFQAAPVVAPAPAATPAPAPAPATVPAPAPVMNTVAPAPVAPATTVPAPSSTIAPVATPDVAPVFTSVNTIVATAGVLHHALVAATS